MSMDAEMKLRMTADVGGAVSGINQVNASLKKLTPGSAQAGTALTNLTRIASDAPFGFIAIQNNLDPLIQSFGSLSKATGGAGGALKALGASLAGPAGIAFGLGAVFALVTAGIQKYGSFNAMLDNTVFKLSDLELANRAVARSFAEAEGKAAGEVAQIKALVNVAQNELLGRNARNEAINKLNKEYGEYLPNLSLENIGTQKVTQSVDKLTASLIKQAKIKGLQDLISKESQKQAELFAGSLEDNLGVIDTFLGVIKGGIAPGAGLLEQAGKSTAIQADAIEKRLTRFNQFLQQLTNEEAVSGTLFVETPKKIKPVKGAEIPELEVKPVLIFQGSDAQRERDRISAILQGEGGGQSEGLAIPINTSGIDKTLEMLRTKGAEAGAAMQELLNTERLQSVANALYENLTPAFQGLFDTMISGGQSALQAVGQFLTQIIKKLAAAAIQAAVFAGIMSAFGLGGGASFGSLFKNNFMGGFGIKGSASPGNMAGRGLANSAPQERLVTSISGNQLNLVLQRTNNSNNRLG